MADLTKEEIPIDFDPRWIRVLQMIKDRFGNKPELETILFLIGMNELGRLSDKFTKEQKQDLMHIAVCKLLSYNGFYKLAGWDDEGWPMWEISAAMPEMDTREQETLLKKNIIHYFELNEMI